MKRTGSKAASAAAGGTAAPETQVPARPMEWYGWAVYDERGFLVGWDTVRARRNDAIGEAETLANNGGNEWPWAKLYRRGWRAYRVTLAAWSGEVRS